MIAGQNKMIKLENCVSSSVLVRVESYNYYVTNEMFYYDYHIILLTDKVTSRQKYNSLLLMPFLHGCWGLIWRVLTFTDTALLVVMTLISPQNASTPLMSICIVDVKLIMATSLPWIFWLHVNHHKTGWDVINRCWPRDVGNSRGFILLYADVCWQQPFPT